MSVNNDDKLQKSKMLEIRDILKNQVNIYSSLHDTLTTTSKGFDKIDDAYTAYGSEIGISSNHISKLKKREFYENLFIYIGFIFFFICVTYIILKRFPIHHLLYLIYYSVEYILTFLSLIYKNINEQFSNILINKSNATSENFTNSPIDYSIFNTTYYLSPNYSQLYNKTEL